MAMKKIIPILLILLLLAGCKIETDIRPDTIVDIPLEPTEAVTEAPTEEVTEATEPPTEAPTEAPTEPPTDKATEKPTEKTQSSSKGSSGKTSSKKPSSNGTSKKDTTEKATEAAKATEPPTEAPTKAPSKPSGSYSPTKLDKAIIAAINEARADAGLPALSTGKKLSNAAAQRAYEISTSWSHSRPDGSSFSTVLKEFGVSGSNAAECLYFIPGSTSASDVVSMWLDSGKDRANLLSEEVDTIGVASYQEDGVIYIAAMFIG